MKKAFQFPFPQRASNGEALGDDIITDIKAASSTGSRIFRSAD